MSSTINNRAQPYRFQANILYLTLHVQPGAKKTEWGGLHGAGAPKLRLAAPAQDGKANKACIRFLAGAAGVPQHCVTIVRGQSSREKFIHITSVSEDRFREMEQQWSTTT